MNAHTRGPFWDNSSNLYSNLTHNSQFTVTPDASNLNFLLNSSSMNYTESSSMNIPRSKPSFNKGFYEEKKINNGESDKRGDINPHHST